MEDPARCRFADPVTVGDIVKAREAGFAGKTRAQTSWCTRVWAEWVGAHMKLPVADEEESKHALLPDFCAMPVESMKFWLCKFVLELRRADGECYPPDSLYAICSGLNRSLKFSDRADINLLSNLGFSRFRGVLNAEMKRLRSTGRYRRKTARVIRSEEEDLLWEKGLLGEHNPKVLLDTLVYYIGLYFAIRGGEHRKLRHNPSQIQLVEPVGGTPYLVFKEDVSKSNQGGLLHRKKVPKQVVHHLNAEAPERCLVRLYKLYNSKCPRNRPNNAFYLKPLEKPRQDVWYTCTPVGHNLLSNTIPRLFKEAGLKGNFTNHSLRATSATRLFDAGVDEQLIMSRTGHSSTGGVRSYKRVTERLQEMTSSVLNSGAGGVAKKRKNEETSGSGELLMKAKECAPTFTNTGTKNLSNELICSTTKENSQPNISFSGATNFTVNFNFNK